MELPKAVTKGDGRLFLVLFIALVFTLQGQNKIKLKNNDIISFIGNSITQDGRYHMILQSYLTTRYPDLALEVYNNGISGDVADGVLYRFEKDILSLQPDYAFLKLGMNDIQRQLYAEGIEVTQEILKKREEALAHYYSQTTHIVALLKEHAIKPIFLTPTIYDQTAKIDQVNDVGCNEALAKCAAHIKMLAKENEAPLVDFYDYLNEINHTGQQKDSTFTIIGPDRIHPGDLGHFAMATK
ncbi:SGNH/GDSL hydrolase family protein [Cellulophaga algicola]|uniref:SGNH/GDSL hydrolase family protein n=1 Tax=Cellulophaga algicola TaxID=59600 RepID=UPI0003134AFD|nr:SGNH/GDSL hydrolase family protein [Cellulophaga algicola]